MIGLVGFAPDELARFVRDWEEWFDAGDYRTMAAHYADDARLVATGTPTVRGRAEVERFLRAAGERVRAAGVRRTVQVEQAECADPVGYMRGTVVLDDTSAPERTTVRYATIWKRHADGIWRLIEDISCVAPRAA